MEKKIKIKYIHSPIGRKKDQKDTIRCFGFTRLNQVKEFPDTPCIRGMVKKIPHLVQVVQ
ncbi:MAG: 50S ribosomal protein L30 [bacterium]|nr:50S ribosomal protein L30 [bacterium]MBU1919136.1 50S ribosomal protein L30 [bacterium]